MRRGANPKVIEPKEKKPALVTAEVKMIQKTESVTKVLQYFKSGKRDDQAAYNMLKLEEEEDEAGIVRSLE